MLVPFPFSDLSGSKVRPAVCLADAETRPTALRRRKKARPVQSNGAGRIGDFGQRPGDVLPIVARIDGSTGAA